MSPVRDAFDAEVGERPDGLEASREYQERIWRPLWERYGLDALSDEWNAADRRMRETIAVIIQTPAQGPFGLAVKLAALTNEPEECDFWAAAYAVLQDVERMTGERFIGASWAGDEARDAYDHISDGPSGA